MNRSNNSHLSSSLEESRVAIVGLGLMGASLAMGLKGHCAQLLGVDSDPKVVSIADNLEIFDTCSTNLKQVLPQANLIILATPIRAILKLIAVIPTIQPDPAIVMDLGSTKTQIVSAMDKLPENFDAIGGHPMCGKEIAGIGNAHPELYSNAPFGLVSLERTSQQTRTLVEQVVTRIGANPIWLNANEHDRWVAYTSHLPYLMAAALSGSLPVQARAMIGPGFRSASRLAATPSAMMLEIINSNRENIGKSIDDFLEEIRVLRDLLVAGEDEQMKERLDKAAGNYSSDGQ